MCRPMPKIEAALLAFSGVMLINAAFASGAGFQNPSAPLPTPSDPLIEQRSTIVTGPRASAGGLQNLSSSPETLIDVFHIYSLPLGISNASLKKTKKGDRLKLSISNTSDEQILGVRYWLLVVDSANQVRSAIDQSESLKLEAYSAKGVSFSAPARLKIGSDDRVFMVVAQVIGRESIWEVRQAREALQDYVKGDGYTMPSVLRLLNQVDSPIGFSPIFLRPKQ